jgi:hypothetical protein
MDRQYVGIDFHRRRSVIVRVNADGQKLATTRVVNDPLAIAAARVRTHYTKRHTTTPTGQHAARAG